MKTIIYKAWNISIQLTHPCELGWFDFYTYDELSWVGNFLLGWAEKNPPTRPMHTPTKRRT